MVELLSRFLHDQNRKIRELDRVFDAIISVAKADDAPVVSGKVKRQLWQPADIPSAEQLKDAFDAIEEAVGEPLLSDSARKIIPIASKGQNDLRFSDPRFRFALTRAMKAGSLRISNLDTAKAKEARELVAALEERARGRIYFSVARRFYKQQQSKNIYKNSVFFYAVGGGLAPSSLKGVHERIVAHLKRELGLQAIDFEVIKRPQTTAKPAGHFHKYGDRLRPGVSLLSPGEMWSSLACLARDPATNVIYAVCSGHGITDYYTAEEGDTVSRRIAHGRDVPVARLTRLPECAVAADADLPIVDFDLALAEVLRPGTAENILDDSDPMQRVNRMRALDSREFEGRAVDISKVGAVSQRQSGRMMNNRSIVNVVDEFGNAKIFLDQIEIRKTGTAFARFGDSGGLIFQNNADDSRSVTAIGAITATGGIGGGSSVTFAVPLAEYLRANKLELLGGGA